MAAKTAYQIVQEKAAKYRIPTPVLWGVYGVETSHGSNVTTSTAGAKGGFQFIEATAKSYNYPYTNTQTQGIFEQQADSAAHYLSDLFHQTGSWDAALQHYSGGGYGWAQVSQQATQGATRNASWQSEIGKIVGNPVEGAGEAVGKVLGEGAGQALKGEGGGALNFLKGELSAGATLAEWLGDPLRIVKLIGGGSLVLMGIWTLTKPGQSSPPTKVAEGALAVVGVDALTARAAGRSARRLRRRRAAAKKPSGASGRTRRMKRPAAKPEPAPAKPKRRVILPPGVEA